MNQLAGVAQAFQDSLPRGAEVIVSRIDSLDRIGVPVVQAVLLGPDSPALSGYGYGVTELEARVGALGELCEEAHVGATVAAAPQTLASYAALTARLGEHAVLDPLTLCLPAGSLYTPDMPLSWVAGQRWPDAAPVMVPAEWVAAHPYQLAAPAQLITPITNGLGAGFDLPHALAHALMELLQRDGNSLTYRALDQGVVVDLPQGELGDVDDLLARLHALGIRPVVKLADTSFGLSNLYVMGDDDGPAHFTLQLSACGEASHPDRARALRKALLEYIGSRSRKAATHGPVETARRVLPPAYLARLLAVPPATEEPRALQAMAEWLGMDAAALSQLLAGPVKRRTRGVAFADLPDAPAADVATSSARLALLATRLAEARARHRLGGLLAGRRAGARGARHRAGTGERNHELSPPRPARSSQAARPPRPAAARCTSQWRPARAPAPGGRGGLRRASLVRRGTRSSADRSALPVVS